MDLPSQENRVWRRSDCSVSLEGFAEHASCSVCQQRFWKFKWARKLRSFILARRKMSHLWLDMVHREIATVAICLRLLHEWTLSSASQSSDTTLVGPWNQGLQHSRYSLASDLLCRSFSVMALLKRLQQRYMKENIQSWSTRCKLGDNFLILSHNDDSFHIQICLLILKLEADTGTVCISCLPSPSFAHLLIHTPHFRLLISLENFSLLISLEKLRHTAEH